MAINSGAGKGTLHSWQRANLVAAVGYLGDLIRRTPEDARAKAVYEGLMEILEPSRRAVRTQRELTTATRAASPAGKDRRSGHDRRRGRDRRDIDLGPPTGSDRRTRGERRRAERRKR